MQLDIRIRQRFPRLLSSRFEEHQCVLDDGARVAQVVGEPSHFPSAGRAVVDKKDSLILQVKVLWEI